MSIIITLAPFIIAGVTTLASTVAALNTKDEQTQEEGQENNQKVIKLSTQIRNEELLQKALRNLGANNISTAGNGVQSNIDEFHVVFRKNDSGVFQVHFVGEIAQAEAEKFRDELQEEYGRVVQDYVYTQLKQKAAEKGLSLENEAVQKDQSIVLTYNINSNG